jgi:hypothetical protein
VELREAWQPSTRANMAAFTHPGRSPTSPGGYTGVQNRLYRVEVHTAGDDGRPVTVKWSRDNACTVVPVAALDGPVATVDPGAAQRLVPGGWVEVSDDVAERDARPGVLAQVSAVDPGSGSVTLAPAEPIGAFDPATHPLLRRWDHGPAAGADRLVGGALPVRPGQEVLLEDGVTVRFGPGPLRSGDYWLVPARTTTADLDWPRPTGAPAALPPHGGSHHLVPLAVLPLRGDPVDCLAALRHRR